MSPAWTIRSLLGWMTQDFSAAGLATPRLDAEVLVAHALGCDRVRLYMDLDRPLAPEELASVRGLVQRRRKREPVAYIVGQREFYRRAFQTTAAVLIPRPDTETLVERALALLPPAEERRALDLCTGSGAIAVTLAAERPRLRVDATDLSPTALLVAAANAQQHCVADRVRCLPGDLFEALPEQALYDLVVSNPPYIAQREWESLAPEITQHEPRMALLAGDDGLSVLDRLCAHVESWLAPGASVLLEVGQGQAELVAERLQQRPALGEVRTHRDLGGVLRVVEARRA
jgi:release factor glutamine methyltransferase